MGRAASFLYAGTMRAPKLLCGNMLGQKGAERMKAVIVGGDERFRHAARVLAEKGQEARWTGEWPKERADVVLVQTEREIKGDNFGLCFVQRGIGERRGTIWLERDEEYLRANAVLTAEGALHAAMGAEGRALYGARCLVAGYGRIGRALCGMLQKMEADVAAAVRPGKSAERARADGTDVLEMEEAKARLGEFDYIWNTVPERIWEEEDLRRLKKGAGLFELASAPYGFDLEQVRGMDIWAERLSGLPGKYCPVSAGKVIAEAMMRGVREKKGAEVC